MQQQKTPEELIQRIRRVATGGAVRIKDAAIFLDVSARTVRRWIAMGILRVQRVTQRTIFIDRTCIEGLVKNALPWDEVDARFILYKKRA
jgi:predicted site-specific integrase-resolvase